MDTGPSTSKSGFDLKVVIPSSIASGALLTPHPTDSDDSRNQRRSSSRSIKRKKFDDELVDSLSTSYPKQKISDKCEPGGPESPLVELDAPASATTPAPKKVVVKKIQTGTGEKPRKKYKKRPARHYVEENNFWKPSDDFALLINVEQTNDLKKVHEGVKFSCKFSYQDVEFRWRSLLYDKNLKNLALAAVRQLHPDIVQQIKANALLSKAELALLQKIESRKEPTKESLKKLIKENNDKFLPERTPQILLKHWWLLRQNQLLNDQSIEPRFLQENVVSFAEIEKIVIKEVEEEMKNPEQFASANSTTADLESLEVTETIEKTMREIRILEDELPKYQSLLDSVTGVSPSDFDSNTYAVLRGRHVRFLMRSTEITIGRVTKDLVVDVNLSLEGPSKKISRLQGLISLQPTGEFIIYNTGKHQIFVESKPLLTNDSIQIHHNSVIEFSSLKFIFLINEDLVLKMRNETLQSCK